MALEALNTEKLTRFWYTPECEREEESPARFLLQPLDGLQATEAFNAGDMGLVILRTLRNGLKDWENVTKDDKSLKCSPQNFRFIHADILDELASEIMTASKMNADEVKNS